MPTNPSNGSRRCRAVVAAFASVLALTAFSGPAGATTIGSTFAKAPTKAGCADSTYANVTVGGGGILAAPTDGAIVRWRLDLFEGGGSFTYRLRIMQPVKGGKYRFVESGPPQTAPSAGVNVMTLPQPLPVSAGDLVAYDCQNGAPAANRNGAFADSTFAFFSPTPEDGKTVKPGNELLGEEALVNADFVAAPTVSAISANGGPSSGGTVVAVTGTELAEVEAVSFGGVAAVVTPVSATELLATAPAHSAGAVDIQVTNPAGTSPASAADLFTYTDPPPPPASPQPPTEAKVEPSPSPPLPPKAPLLSAVTQTHAAWRLPGHLPKGSGKRPPVGTSIGFQLDEAASVTLSFTRVTEGRRVGGKCVAAGQAEDGKPRCPRSVAAGAETIAARAGANLVPLQGRLSSGKKLAPGRYTLAVVATDAAGQVSSVATLRFRIVASTGGT